MHRVVNSALGAAELPRPSKSGNWLVLLYNVHFPVLLGSDITA